MHKRYRRKTLQSVREMQPTEEEIQIAVFRWASMSQQKYPELRMMFAVPNGMHSNPIHVRRMKAAGLRPGVPDVWLPVARNGWNGLVIEMKTKTGRVSEDQAKWLSWLGHSGHQAIVCRSFEEAKKALEDYLS